MPDTLAPRAVQLMPPVSVSPTLAADALAHARRQQGQETYHMGFGQAPFPAPKRLIDAMQTHAHEKGYLPVAGLPELRRAVIRHQHRLLGTDMDGVDVLVAPGSKLILYAVQMAVTGDLLLPTPSWVSYAPQAAMLGQKTIAVPSEQTDAGYLISGETLARAIRDARAAGKNPTKLLLNYPNNPTGLSIPDTLMQEIAQVCIDQGIVIIADEIYGRLAFEGPYRSISAYAPEHTVVTTGLSKHLSVGGWRLGVGVIPKSIGGLFDVLSGIASETWSCVAAPIQIAAIEAYEGHDDIENFISDCSKIHAAVTRYIASSLRAIGADCVDAQGGFYLWPDFAPIANYGASTTLSHDLITQAGVVTLPGLAFGEDPAVLRLRLSACDYDGADALAVLHGSEGRITPEDVPRFAPRIPLAMSALKQFFD